VHQSEGVAVKLFLKASVIAVVTALFAACGGSTFELFPDTTTTTTTTTTTPAVNIAPVANAGSAQSVIVNDLVLLNGSNSSDANGDSLTYSWTLTKPAGSAATLSSATAVEPTFTADVAGTYSLSLVVNDGKVSSSAATVTVTAFTTPPTASAGPDQSVIVGTTVQLDGSASSGANLVYNWQFTAKPVGAGNVLLSSATAVNPTFTPTVAGNYVIQLQVFDRSAGSQTDTVTVTVTPSNTGSITVTW